MEEARAALAKTSGVEQEDDEVLTVEQELEKRKNAADSNGKNLSGVWVFGFGCWNQGFCFFLKKTTHSVHVFVMFSQATPTKRTITTGC